MEFNEKICHEYCEKEKRMIESYCYEMKMEYEEKDAYIPIEGAIHKIVERSTEKVKKIIIFELIGLSMVDGKFHIREKEMVWLLSNRFGLDDSFIEKCEKIIEEYVKFQTKINQLILD